jgi:membrane protein
MTRLTDRVLTGFAVGVALAALVKRPAHTVEGETSPEWRSGHELPSSPPPSAGPSRWRFLLGELTARFREHHTGIVAGSLAYYAMLTLVPSLIATVAIYGIITDPAELELQIASVIDNLPRAAASLITEQLEEIVTANEAGLGLTAAISLALALWSASAGMKTLIQGINLAYGAPETRSFFRLRGMALVMTLGGAVFIGVLGWLVGLVSVAAGEVWQETLLAIGTLIALVVGLGVLYKVAPNRTIRSGPLASPGAMSATVLLVLTTLGFTLYVRNFGSFNATYGALAGVVLLLLWFFISGFVVLLGAELNAEMAQLRRRRSGQAV